MRKSVYETIAELEEADLLLTELPDEEAERPALPEGLIDVLGTTTTPRRGWGQGCGICGERFQDADRIRPVLAADGSRPYVHASHLEGSDPSHCRHGEPAASCERCRAATGPRMLSKTFRARRKGRCILCGQAVRPLELIARVASHAGIGFAHAEHLG